MAKRELVCSELISDITTDEKGVSALWNLSSLFSLRENYCDSFEGP